MYSDFIHSMNKQTKTGKTDEGREIIPICGLGASVECSLMRSCSEATDRDYFSSSIRLFSQHLFV